MFQAACAAVPACSPSRTAMLLGQDPMKTEVFVNEQLWLDAKNVSTSATLVGHFRANGWVTEGTGKTFHGSLKDLRSSDWTDYWLPENYDDRDGTGTRISASASAPTPNFDFGPGDGPSAPDVATTDWAIGRISDGYLDQGGCFLALGLNRPHLPQVVPQKYFDLYPERVALPPGYWPGSTDIIGNRPDRDDLGHSAHVLQNIYGIRSIGEIVSLHHELNDFLRAYYAAASFVDDQLGRVLDALDERSLHGSTYLVVVSDNGFMLGEKETFSKFQLHELSVRVPLLIAGPGIVPRVVREPVSLVDLYPTLCGLAGLPIPPQCDGQDLSSALMSGTAPSRPSTRSYSGFLREKTGEFYLHSTVRTPQWRLISYSPIGWRSHLGYYFDEVELYDHDPASPTHDPNEWYNIADKRPDVVEKLRQELPDPQTLMLTLSRGIGHGD
jgi:arylsulfatase A-like enzyme